MTHLRALAISCLIVASQLTVGEATPSQDPVSGQWGIDGTTLLDLAHDGRGAVSGTVRVVVGGITMSAPVGKGTFDLATRTLELSGEMNRPNAGGVAPYVITAQLDADAMNVRYTFGAESGSATLRRILAPAPAAAAVTSPAGGSAVLRKQFDEVNARMIKAAEFVPDEKYAYKPTPTVRTLGQLIAHVVDSYNYFCATAAGKSVQWADAVEKGTSAKAALVQRLKTAASACSAAYSGLGDHEALIGNIAHTNLHYGNVITYMRMMGLVPPSS